MSNTDIKHVGGINIWMFHSQHTAKPPLTFKELKAMEISDPTCQVDLLWDISLPLGCKRPAWSGMMQTIHKEGNHPGKSSVLFLPMADMDPSNLTCISSMLWYVCDLAKCYGVNPIITFDQPLYWKAMLIIDSESSQSDLKSVVVRLGGLHLQMSFLGCVGHLMAASGLTEVLEVMYAENTVKHIVSGKAMSRAIRGHLMILAALNTILLANAYNLPLPTYTEAEDGHDSAVPGMMTRINPMVKTAAAMRRMPLTRTS